MGSGLYVYERKNNSFKNKFYELHSIPFTKLYLKDYGIIYYCEILVLKNTLTYLHI